MKKFLFASLVAALTSTAFAASNPATATFEVKLTVLKACSVVAGAASDIDFGSQDANPTANLQSNKNISVTCSKGTAYTIGLLSGNNSTNTAGLGLMKAAAPNNDSVGYQLRSTAGLTGTVWGNTNTSGTVVGNGVGGTGTGAAIAHTVYATVPDTNVTPDSYKDTVTVSVRY